MAEASLKGAESYKSVTESLHSMYTFYKDAAASTPIYRFEDAFWQLAASRLYSAKKLQPIAKLFNTDDHCSASFFINARRIYTASLCRNTGEREKIYTEHLLQMERKILYEIEKILNYRLPLRLSSEMAKCREKTADCIAKLNAILDDINGAVMTPQLSI